MPFLLGKKSIFFICFKIPTVDFKEGFPTVKMDIQIYFSKTQKLFIFLATASVFW